MWDIKVLFNEDVIFLSSSDNSSYGQNWEVLLRCGKFYHFLLLPMLVKELAERYGLKS